MHTQALLDKKGPFQNPERLLEEGKEWIDKIEQAKYGINAVPSTYTIHDLVKLYSEYVHHLKEVIGLSLHPARNSEDTDATHPSDDNEYSRLLRQELELDDAADANAANIYEIPKSEPHPDVEQEAKPDFPFAIADLTRSLALFEPAFREVSKDGVFVTERRVWYPKLKEANELLTEPVFSNKESNEKLSEHMMDMSLFLQENKPDPAESWKGGALKGNETFDATFESFKLLGAQMRFPKNDSKRKELLRGSSQLLRKACSDLLLDWKAVDIEWKALVDPTQRPTYIRVPNSDPHFTVGQGTNGSQGYLPGILDVKHALGCDPKTDSTGKANTSKRRSSGSDDGPAAKRQHTKAPAQQATDEQLKAFKDSFNLAYADADIGLFHSFGGLAKAEPAKCRQVMTPLVANRDVTMKNYQKDFKRIVQAARRLHDRVYSNNNAASARQLLAEIEQVTKRVRDEIAALRGVMNATSLKKQRLAAFKLVYHRALAVRLVAGTVASRGGPTKVSGNGLVVNDMDDQHKKRFEDWIEHERAWNDADKYAYDRLVDPEPYLITWAKRAENIEHWGKQVEALEARMAKGLEAQNGGAAAAQGSASTGQAVAADTPTEPQPEPVRKFELTEEDLQMLETRYTGTILTNRCFRERRLDFSYQEDKDSRGPNGVDTFAAGGPPGYKCLPTRTNWEKLQYMIVLTHWRYHQAFECHL
ncbi:hypothetical protein PG989_015466 [Apiospora arundinis]|uniref:Uncharacterized protein n=1 Tax=Apiospora arundinis TaxID=335852 RepID=A0ABR2JIV3_9PEZI